MLAKDNVLANDKGSASIQFKKTRHTKNVALMILTSGCGFIAFTTGIYIVANLVFDFMKTNWQKNYDIVDEAMFILLILARVLVAAVSMYPLYPAFTKYTTYIGKAWLHIIAMILFAGLWSISVIWSYSHTDLIFIFFGTMAFVSCFLVYACPEKGFTNNYSSSWLA